MLMALMKMAKLTSAQVAESIPAPVDTVRAWLKPDSSKSHRPVQPGALSAVTYHAISTVIRDWERDLEFRCRCIILPSAKFHAEIYQLARLYPEHVTERLETIADIVATFAPGRLEETELTVDICLGNLVIFKSTRLSEQPIGLHFPIRYL